MRGHAAPRVAEVAANITQANQRGRRQTMNDSDGDIREIIFSTLRTTLKRPVELSDQTHIMDDLGLDSVAVMDFVMDLEDRLDVSMPLDRIAEIETLGDLIATLRNLKADASAA